MYMAEERIIDGKSNVLWLQTKKCKVAEELNSETKCLQTSLSQDARYIIFDKIMLTNASHSALFVGAIVGTHTEPVFALRWSEPGLVGRVVIVEVDAPVISALNHLNIPDTKHICGNPAFST